MSDLNGKVALVTCAARGIGRAIALELARRGASIVVNYRNCKAEAEELAEQLKTIGVPVLLVQGDVAHPDEARKVVTRVMEQWKRLDILVNNAGITHDHTPAKAPNGEWADVIHVSLNGTFYCTSAVIPAMVDQKFGRIINISSYTGQAGHFGQAEYAASKGGITAFTKALALEMARYNITANTVAPGFTSTDILAHVPANIQDQIKAKIPMGRFGTPEEVARTVAFLACEGDYITGQQINVNGGMYM